MGSRQLPSAPPAERFAPQLALAPAPEATPGRTPPPADPRALVATLTEAELRIATLLAEGLVPKQIAAALEIGLPTVRSHIASAKRRTGARTIEQLAGIVAQATLPPRP